MDSSKVIERSVDSLQRIYAVIVALAISQAIVLVFTNPGTKLFELQTSDISYLPPFIAFIVTVVPFYHGMNRHLDQCYITKNEQRIQGALLFDFIVFFLEAALLFAFATSVSSGIGSFVILGIILLIDTIWSIISHWIHYKRISPSVRRWAGINAVTVVLGVIIYSTNAFVAPAQPWLLMLLALVRSFVDYVSCWEFYFPST